LVTGNVNVSRAGGVVTRFSSGDCFGEMGYVSRTKRTASIQTANDVSLIRINEAQMEQASESCQLRFHKAFLHTLIDRLAHSSGDELAALGVEAANRPVAPNLARQATPQPLIQAEG
jgi:CRP-like cAMP-binding protein